MADDPDDADPTERKSSRGGKKRFQERDERDDDDDDNGPRKKKRAGDDDDDDRPKKRRRVDDGPRVKTTDNMPIVMLLAFIGSAVALLVICAGCGVWSFDWLVGGGPAGGGGGGGGGGSGHEFEVVSAGRTPGFGALSAPNISYAVKQNKELSGSGVYVVVMRCGGVTTSEPFPPPGKGGSYSSTRPQMSLRSTSGKLEVWVERRQNPVASGGTVVSNTYVVP